MTTEIVASHIIHEHCLNIGCHISYDFFSIVVFLYFDARFEKSDSHLILCRWFFDFFKDMFMPFFFKNGICFFVRFRISVLIQRQLLPSSSTFLIAATTRPKCIASLTVLTGSVLRIVSSGTPLTAFDWLSQQLFLQSAQSLLGLVFPKQAKKTFSYALQPCMCLHTNI